MLVAIPARHGSTRFPGKPLAPVLGRPMIAWVVDAARGARRAEDVAVITDREEIAAAAREAGARAVVSDREAASGSDRIAQLLELDPVAARATTIVNLQGDEPALESAAIDRAIELLEERAVDVATLVRAPRAGERIADPDLVKAVLASDGRALYFSRAAVPHGVGAGAGEEGGAGPWIHVGLYAWRRPAFDRFTAAPPSALERAERLEQLRAIDLGLAIGCAVVQTESVGVDAPADVPRAEAALRRLDAIRARP
ncbi:MAG: 3-deoxy-manno-octulosonate cytidylyltransferase [Gemmatimonadota bacterium]